MQDYTFKNGRNLERNALRQHHSECQQEITWPHVVDLMASHRVNLRGGAQLCSTFIRWRGDGIVRRRCRFFYYFFFSGHFWKRWVYSPLRHLSSRLLITEPWHSSACRHSPLECLATSGIKLHILLLLSFAICSHPQNEGDVNLGYILVSF